jgi:hypothetical protein
MDQRTSQITGCVACLVWQDAQRFGLPFQQHDSPAVMVTSWSGESFGDADFLLDRFVVNFPKRLVFPHSYKYTFFQFEKVIFNNSYCPCALSHIIIETPFLVDLPF